MSVVNVYGIEDHLADELNMKPTNTLFIKPFIIVQCKYKTSGKVKEKFKKKKVILIVIWRLDQLIWNYLPLNICFVFFDLLVICFLY